MPGDMRVCDFLLHSLHKEGVEYLFGVTGKTITPIFDATYNYPIKPIFACHEAGASYMAFGYAQASRKIGVCCGASSSGGLNIMPGVAAAWMSSVPMIVITGQVPTTDFGKGAFQDATDRSQSIGRSVDLINMFGSITKASKQILNVQKAPDTIRNAIKLAMSGRQGPVHLSIPLDINLAKINSEVWQKHFSFPINQQLCDENSLQQVIALINQAKKPVFLLGWGGVFSRANVELLMLAEKLNIPIATTPDGKGGIPSNHELCLGIMGLCGHDIAREYIFEKSDLVMAIGTTFNEFSTLNWDSKIASNKKLIQIDIDYEEIGKNYPVDIGLVGDAKTILKQLLQLSSKTNLGPKDFKKMSTARWDLERYCHPEEMLNNSLPLKPQLVMRELRDSTPDETIFLGDSGSHWGWVTHNIPIYKGGKFFPILGLGSMGTAICSSMGIKLVESDVPVICVCGDGCFQMSGSEISTAAKHKIPVIWIIMNDGCYNMPLFGIKNMYGRGMETCILCVSDFVKFANSFGIKGYCVEKPGELTKIMPEVLALKEPVVIDVHTDPSVVAPVGRRLKYNPNEACQ